MCVRHPSLLLVNSFNKTEAAIVHARFVSLGLFILNIKMYAGGPQLSYLNDHYIYATAWVVLNSRTLLV